MARQLMAVYVVCLLCADHLPCEKHFETSKLAQNASKLEVFLKPNENHSQSNAFENSLPKQEVMENDGSNLVHTKRKGRTKFDESTDVQKDYRRKAKRHAVTAEHSSSDEISHAIEKSQIFLKKLFQQFGDAEGKTMSIEGFEKMLKRLQLYSLIEDKIPKEHSVSKSLSLGTGSTTTMAIKPSTETCISSGDLLRRMSPSYSLENQQKNSLESSLHETKLITNGHSTKNMIGNSSIKGTFDNHSNEEDEFTENLYSTDIYAMCPILLYQMAAPTSLERSGCIDGDLLPADNFLSHSHYDEPEKESRVLVWMYSSIAVLGVSLVGLLGVAVIPCMDGQFYQHTIQFLVALAVGTLAGDAFLHLLPHAMLTIATKGDSHKNMTWIGLIAVLGIIFFFATERGLTMIAEWKKKIEKKEKPSSRVRVMREPDAASINNSTTGDKLCKSKYSSYPYCYDEIAMETKDDHHHHHHHDDKNEKNTTTKPVTPVLGNHKNNLNRENNHQNHQSDNNETVQSLLSPTQQNNYTTISDSYSDMHKDEEGGGKILNNQLDNNTVSTNFDTNSCDGGIDGVFNEKPPKEETYRIILREHETTHHGHSHKHGHVHSPPGSLSAVAWMVIMGDGLHNFTDGMAIGAAFSNNIAGGFSTAIAVFCHELPHELGDFAVLLKAGMSARQAVAYNLLSSILSFFGMILGVLIGDTPEASAWVFAVAAGMFIYIALVDMMPELTSAHDERCALSQCLLQIFGMSCGLGIMLLIALYEHDLKNIFSTTSDHHH